MTEHQRPAAGDGPPPAAPLLEVPALVRAGAGTACTVEVVVTNAAEQARIVALSVHGVDPDWLPAPQRGPALAPGERIGARLTLRPAPGTVAARYPIAVAAQALDPSTGQATGPVTLAELVLVVDAPGEVGVSLEPAEVRTVFGKKIRVRLHNTGTAATAVDLEAQTPSSARLHLARRQVDVPAGRTVTVAGRVRPRRVRLVGGTTRQTFTVTGRGRGAARHVEGLLAARAVLGPTAAKVLALLAVVGLWVGLAVVFVPKLADRIEGGSATTVVAQSAAPTAPATGGPGGGGPGSGGPGGPGGPDGPGGSGSGSAGPSGSRGPGGTGDANSVQLNGTVTGNSPSGVTVSLSPTALVSEAAQDATPVGLSAQAVSALRLTGKIPSSALTAPSATESNQHRSVTTSQDGAWSFPGVPKPGYYLLSFSKPGFQTVSYVVNSATASPTKPLTVTMAAGQGQLNGVVTGPGGERVGGATVTLTDGTDSVTTSTDSTGDVGSWSVVGLSTPASYLVSASAPGLSTSSKLVPLDASGSASVSLRLQAGVAAITGTVGALDGTTLGGVTVSATDGAKLQRSATTVTEDGLRGRYTLSGLPVPGRYTLTFSADGYLTQTVRVSLAKGQSGTTQDVTLFPATATVTGTVVDDPANPPDATAGLCAGPDRPRSGAGLILTSKDDTYKTTSGDCGDFRFDGVAPGSYVLSAQYAGRTTEFRTVTVRAGATAPITIAPITLTNLAPQLSTASIVGFVTDGSNPSNTLCAAARAKAEAEGKTATCTVKFTLRDQHGADVALAPGSDTVEAATAGPTAYTLHLGPNVSAEPGVYKLSISATGKSEGAVVTTYLPVTVTVRLPLTGAASAPAANLFLANTISGQVNADSGKLSDDGSGKPVTNCVYAVPLGMPAPDLTKPCDPGVDGADTSQCTVTGAQGPAYAALNADDSKGPLGSYSMTVCDGYYFVYVAIENPWYHKVTSPPGPFFVSVSKGQAFTVPDVTVTLRAKIALTINQVPLDSLYDNPKPFSSQRTVDISCTDPATHQAAEIAPSSTQTNAGSKTTVTVGGLSTDSGWTCTGTIPGTDFTPTTTKQFQPSGSGPPLKLVTMTFHQTVGTVFGQLVTDWSGTTQPVGGGEVTVSGRTSAGDGTVTVNPAAHGCFAITPDGAISDPSAIPKQCTELSRTATAVATLPLTHSDNVTFTVVTPPPGYRQPAAPTTATVSTNGTVTVGLYPNPVALSGLKVQTDPDTGSSLDGFAISVAKDGTGNPEQPAGAGNVDLSVGDDGTVTWDDDQFTDDNRIAPGTYTLVAGETGYVPATYTFTCTPGGQCTVGSTPGSGPAVSSTPFTVDKLGGLTVKLAEDGGAPFTDSVVNLYAGTTLVDTRTTTGTSVTFDDLSPTRDRSSGQPYSVQVHAAGYQFGSTDGQNGPKNVALDCGAGKVETVSVDPGTTPTCKATPTRDGAIEGQVILVMGDTTHLQYPAAGTPIVACPGTEVGDPQAGDCPSGAHAFTGETTGTDGEFTLTGDTDVQGLDPGTQWTLATALDGYDGGKQTVTLPAAGATGWPDYEVGSNPADSTDPCTDTTNICLNVKTVTVRVTVTDQAGSVCDGLTVALHGDYGDQQSTSCEAGLSYYEFDDVVPGGLDVSVHQYTISASGYGYMASSQSKAVKLDDGTPATQIQTFDLPIVRDQSTVSGTVEAVHDHTGMPSGIAGATVCLVAATSKPSVLSSGAPCPSDKIASETTAADGIFSWGNIPDTPQDPDGTEYYLVVVPPYGYDGAVSDGFTVSGNKDDHAEPPFELAQIKNKLTVTVVNQSADEDLSGTSWAPTLTSSTDPDWALDPQTPTYDSGSNETTFIWNGVPTGCWAFSFANQPSEHHGELKSSTPWPSDSTLACTGNQIAVSDAAESAGQVAAGYTFNEFQPSIEVTVTPLSTDSDVPTTATLVLQTGGKTVYTDDKLPVSTPITLPVWVSTAVATASANSSNPGWPSVSAIKFASASTVPVPIKEMKSTLTVTVIGKTDGKGWGKVNVHLDPPRASVTAPGDQKTSDSGPDKGNAEFSDLAYGTWTVTASKDSYTQTKDVTIGGPAIGVTITLDASSP